MRPDGKAPVVAIQSRDNPLLRRIRRLLQRPGAYREEGAVWIEGDHLVRAALDRGCEPLQSVITELAWETRPDLRALAQRARGVAVVSPALMASISSLESPAAVAVLLPWPLEAVAQAHAADDAGVQRHAECGDGLGLRRDVDTVVLDRLQDPGNVGSILRTAAALGVRQVVALTGTVALGSPKVLRAGMGAHFTLRLFENVAPATLLERGPPLVVTSSHEAQALDRAVLPRPCAWVFGHEGGGVDPRLSAAAALRVRIPQPGGQESLNVAAAAAICLYEQARRQAQP